MTRRVEFDAAVRRGRRAGRPRLVAYAYAPAPPTDEPTGGPVSGGPVTGGPVTGGPVGPATPRVGFVVSRAVGGSVVRNRVARRLRHVMRARLGPLPAGLLLVIRALPPAATATSAELAADLDAVLRRLRLAGAAR